MFVSQLNYPRILSWLKYSNKAVIYFNVYDLPDRTKNWKHQGRELHSHLEWCY